DDVQEREPGSDRRAPDLDELAVVRSAAARQAARAQVEPAPETVDRSEVDERPSPSRLPEDRDRKRFLPEDGPDRRTCNRVELPVGEARLRRDAAPHRLDRAVARGELPQGPLDCPVLDGRAADGGR